MIGKLTRCFSGPGVGLTVGMGVVPVGVPPGVIGVDVGVDVGIGVGTVPAVAAGISTSVIEFAWKIAVSSWLLTATSGR